jgi:signal transduction histidine kinase/ActR/RegA family two-component response regulator
MIRDHPRFRETAIIFVSGVHLTELDRLRGYSVGAVDYVPVPIVPEILRAKVTVFANLFRQTRQLERLNQELEQRVMERTAELEKANQRKDEFLAVLSHELRNPLAAIRAAAEMLAVPELSGEHLAKTTGVIRRQVTQLARLIDDLVDVSRITRDAISLRREPVLVSHVVAHAAEATRPIFDVRKHQLTIQIPDPTLTVDGDPARLSQVIGNILNNSAKFTAPGGNVLVHASQVGSHVAIHIKDNGIGIAPEVIPKVFELFTQAGEPRDRSEEGLGIGLALVRRLVEMHEGHVRVNSEGIGRGTEVIVTLPLVEAQRSDAAAESTNKLPTSRIVLADDNADAVAALELLLKSWGHEVKTAADGLEAVEAVQEFRPEVVLLDLGMPRMDGYEAARRIRKQTRGQDVVLIALTGWGQPQDRIRTREAGFDAHLVKPVSDDELIRTIRLLTGNSASESAS